MVIKLKKSLEEQGKSRNEITGCLLGLNCRKQVYNGENQCMFRNKQLQLQACSTIAEIWYILRDYFSFFDFYIIDVIATELGTKDDQLHVERYKEEFGNYLKCRVFTLKIDISKEDSEELVLILDCSFEECNFANLVDLRVYVSKLLNLEQHVVRLGEIKQGCIQLVLLIPEFIFKDTFPLTTDQKLILQWLKVSRLDCGNFHFHHNRESQSQSQSNGKYYIEGTTI